MSHNFVCKHQEVHEETAGLSWIRSLALLAVLALALSACGGGNVPWDPSLLKDAGDSTGESDVDFDTIDFDGGYIPNVFCESDDDCSALADKFGECYQTYCDTTVGQCYADKYALDGEPCDDGLFCTVNEACNAGQCAGGEANTCDDEVECTVDQCIEDTNECTHEADDGLCDGGSDCSVGTCDAEDGCTYVGDDTLCDDGVDCTVDSCEPGTGCVNEADDTACDDGVFCNGAETCSTEEGCVAGEYPVDDGIECTVDECDEDADEVTHTPDNTVCDDGDFCNGEEVCDLTDGCIAGEPPVVPDVDVTCDGVDDDCDGETDEDYVPDDTCGEGICQATNTPSTCVDGVETPCMAGTGSDDDATCNGVDEDCDGTIDEDYVPDDTCGVGACMDTNTPSTCIDGVETPCQPGTPAADDTTCDGVDEDCDGTADEDYVPDDTCGVGLCLTTNTPSTCQDGVETPCEPGTPAAEDITCDHIDDDCDGEEDEDAVPECDYGEPVVGLDVAFNTTEGMWTGITVDNGDGTYSSEIVDLTDSNAQGTVIADANGTESRPANFTIITGDVAKVDLTISRTMLYADDAQLDAYAYITDDLGAPVGAGETVTFTFSLDGTDLDVGGSYISEGLYHADFTAPAAAFAADNPGTVVAEIDTVNSNVENFSTVTETLELIPAVGEMAIQLPLGPRFDGSEFEVPVLVSTGTNTVGSYDATVTFDPAVLQVEAVLQGDASVMAPPTNNLANANVNGVLQFNSINTEPALTGPTQAQGEAVEVARLRFSIISGTPDATVTELTGTLNDLFNTTGAGVSFLTNGTIAFSDANGVGNTGEVEVKNLAIQGLVARIADNTLVDLYEFDGNVSDTTLEVLGLFNDGSVVDVSSSADVIITSNNDGIASVLGNTVTAESRGSTQIVAEANSSQAEANIWVLTPDLPLEVNALDNLLGWIPELDRYQQTGMEVLATFTDGTDFNFILDVTDHVDYTSTNTGILAVNGGNRTVSGVADGTANVDVSGTSGTQLGTTEVTVDSNVEVTIESVLVLVPANVDQQDTNPEDVEDASATTAVEASATNLFSGEGQTAQVSTILVFSDDAETDGGSRQDITDEPTVEYVSSDDTIGTVDENGLVTAVGGGEAQVNATYSDGAGNVIITGDGPFAVALPDAVNVLVTVADPRLALTETDVAFTLLGLPVKRQMTVTVFFADGTSMDFTNDSRTVYDAETQDPNDRIVVTNPDDCDGAPDCNSGEVESTGNEHGTATVHVSFPGTYLSNVEESVEFEVVTHQDITAESWELFTPAGTPRVIEHVLSYIEGTGVWQRSQLEVLNSFTDGSVLDITTHPQTSYAIYDVGTTTPNVAILELDPGAMAHALAEGQVDIVATNSGHDTPPLTMTVDGNQEDIADLHMNYDSGSTVEAIITEVAGNLNVYATFADGTRNWLTGDELIAGLLRFESDRPDYSGVDQTGAATAEGNGQVLYTVDVTDANDTGTLYDPPTAQSLPVNLLPDVGDVDMGNPTLLAFPDRNPNEFFELPVRVNTGALPLGGIDVEIYYDPEVLQFDDLALGSGIPGALFSYSVLTPGTILFNATPSLDSQPSGTTEVAVISFMAMKGGDLISEMGGEIRSVIDNSGATVGAPTPRPFVSGAGDLDPPPGGVWGDADDDNVFSVADVLFIQQQLAGTVTPNPTQLAQSDIFPDGEIIINDAFYGSQNLARLTHFIDPVVTPDPSNPNEYDLEVAVIDRDQAAVMSNVQVRFEFATTANAPTIMFSNPAVATASGLMTNAVDAGLGMFTTHISGLTTPESIGVVVIVDVLDDGGVLQNSTPFLETPELDVLATFKPIITIEVDDICADIDDNCDGVDDDCDGTPDDDYVPDATCGVGLCLTNNIPSTCVGGVETACQPGTPAPDDANCNNVDDDCDTEIDEDYVSDDTCGVGACLTNNTPSTCVAGVETPCQPGTPAADDTTCDGVDENCDGTADEGYVADDTCGVGYCFATNTPSACVGGVETPCQPGSPLDTVDTTCDHVDDDCDGTDDEDAVPECDYAQPVTGADVVFSSTLGIPSGLVTDNDDGTYDSDVHDITNGGTMGQVTATVNGNPSAPEGFTVTNGDLTGLDLVASKTEVVADEPSVRLYAYLTDALGSPMPSTTPVNFTWTLDGTPIVLNGSYVANGIFEAVFNVPAGTFAAGATGDIVAQSGALLSDPVTVTVLPAPATLALNPGEVGLVLPLSARFNGAEFDVPVLVNTGSYTVGSYNFTVNFDNSVLEVVSVSQGVDDLAPPVSNADTTANALGALSFNSINIDSDGIDTATGAAVEVATIRMRVLDAAADGAMANITGTVVELNNTVGAGASFVSNATIQLWDSTGRGDTGVVHVLHKAIEGVFLRLADNALVNWFMLTGNAATTNAIVTGVWSDGTLANISTEPFTLVDSLNGTVAMALGDELSAMAPGEAVIEATVNGHRDDATLWILGPQIPVTAAAKDPVLQNIPALGRMQDTWLEVEATFTDGNMFSFNFDVTDLVDFASASPVVASVDNDGHVMAVGQGVAVLNVLGQAGILVGNAPLTVNSTDTVNPTGIHVVIPAMVTMEPIDPSEILDETGTTPVRAEVTSLFTAEGQMVQGSAYLMFDDDATTDGGSRVDITAEPNVSYSSLNTGIGTVDGSGIVTAVGGGETDIKAVLDDGSGGTIADGLGHITVNLPAPVSVTATVPDNRIAIADDDPAATVLGLPTSRQITVTVQFADGSQKTMTTDARTIYDADTQDPQGLISAEDATSCGTDPACNPGEVAATGNSAGTAIVEIRFSDTYLGGLSTTVEFEVVEHTETTLASWELYTPVPPRVAENTLSLIEGSGVYQRSQLEVIDVFSDGSTVDITNNAGTTFMIYQPGTTVEETGVLAIDGAAIASAIADGDVDVVAMAHGDESATLAMTVNSTQEDIANLNMAYPGGSTLLGIKDLGQGQMTVWCTYADGTRNWLTGAELIPGLLAFDSDRAEFATIDASGLATVHGNGAVTFLVDVADGVDSGISFDPPASLALPVNLLPDVGDVDLGNPLGLAHPDRIADEVFLMPVRVNTGGLPLGGVDVEVTYDPTVLEALDATVGIDVPGALFSGNVSEPGVIYFNVSPSVTGGQIIGDDIEIAVFEFKAIKTGGPAVTPIAGVIRGVIDSDGATIGEATPKAIVAGAGDLDPDGDGLYGDADDDGEFTVGDVLFIQKISVDPPLIFPNPTQAAQSDIFPDGETLINDAFFGSLVLARLSHFMEGHPDGAIVPNPSNPAEVDLRVVVVNRDQQPVTGNVRVRFELATVANLGSVSFTNPHTLTTSGVITTAVHEGGGVYSTHIRGMVTPESGIGVVVFVDVLDGNGAVVNTVAFIESPVLDPAGLFLPYLTFDVPGVTPADNCCDQASIGQMLVINGGMVGESAFAGDGLDLDLNAMTCLPGGNCGDGVENEGSSLYSVINPVLATNVWPIVSNIGGVLMDFTGATADGNTFFLPAYFGGLNPVGPACDYRVESCGFVVNSDNFDEFCQVRYGLSNARIVGTTLTAGGPGNTIEMDAWYNNTPINVTAYDVQLAGELTGTPGAYTAFDGLIGFAVERSALHALLDMVPDGDLPAGYSKAMLHGWIDMMPADYDVDGDGMGDAISIGLKITMGQGAVDGCSTPCNSDADCDDEVACTDDSCDYAGGCVYAPNDSLCDDGNVCTVNTCDAEMGCTTANAANGTACDDGMGYTLNDQCVDGVCLGVAENCCDEVAFGPVLALSDMLLGETATLGDGLDLDQDINTCLPGGTCADGVENEASLLAAVINSALEGAVDSLAGETGSLLLDLHNVSSEGTAFWLPGYFGALDPMNAGCDLASQSCAYAVHVDNFTGQCLARYGFDNAVINGNELTAGGPGTLFPLDAWYGTTQIQMNLYDVQLRGTLAGSMGMYSGFAGVLGFAVQKDALHTILDMVDDADIPAGYTKAMLHGWIDALPADYDIDNDGTGDAISLGLKVTMLPATVSECNHGCTTNADCDDGVSCSVDTCDLLGTCTHTVTDSLCDDSNECTTEYCDATADCVYEDVANGTPCDDGDSFTYGDQCINGECQGMPEGTGCCETGITFGDSVAIQNVALSSTSGVGLDLGQSIVDGVNDAFTDYVLYEVRNKGTLLMDFINEAPGAFDVPIYFGAIDPTQGACDPTVATCDFTVHEDNFDVNSCGPLHAFSGTISGNTLHAESPLEEVVVSVAGMMVVVEIEDIVVDGTLSGTSGAWTGFAGTMQGVLAVEDLAVNLDLIPDSALETIGLSLGGLDADSVRDLLENFLWAVADGEGKILGVLNVNAGDSMISGCASHCGSDAECDDGFACTADFCDSLAGCWHQTDDAACDDGNECTVNTCSEASGCELSNVADGTPCDDGVFETTNDQCVSGVCEDVSGTCCDHVSFGGILAASTLEAGDTATAADGLDLDLNVATCLPAGSCSDGVENELSALAAAVNGIISGSFYAAASEQGSLLMDFGEYTADGVPFFLPGYIGATDPLSTGCDLMAGGCDFVIHESNFQNNCLPKYGFDNAVINGSLLTAGGPETNFPVHAWYGTTLIEFTAYHAQLNGTLSGTPGSYTGFEGLIGFAVERDVLHDLLDLASDSDIPAGYSKAMLHGWIDALPADYDVDGDGTGDAISIGIHLGMKPGNITQCSVTCSDDSDCDDGVACTVDQCTLTAGCIYEPVGTLCDDGNPCTVDMCDAETDCYYEDVTNGTVCDDGNSLTYDDTCLGGECIGMPTGTGCCESGLSFGDVIAFNDLALSDADGLGAELGASLMSSLDPIIDGVLLYEVSNSGTLLMDFINETGGVFETPLYFGALDPEPGACDPVTSTCDFLVHEDNFGGASCDALYVLDASITGTQYHGEAAEITAPVAVQGVMTALSLYDVSLDGTLTGVPGDWTGFVGTLRADIDADTIKIGIDVIPDATLEDLGASFGGLSASAMRSLLKGFADSIADTNGRVLVVMDIASGDGVVADCTSHCSSDAACDDGFDCTTDHCDGLAGCWYETDDVTCDDSNVCTTEVCTIGLGCEYTNVANGTTCDDGLAYTGNDVCTDGYCAGVADDCCTNIILSDALGIAQLSVGTAASVGEGLDLDWIPATCLPDGSCSDGVENEVSQLYALVNPLIEDALYPFLLNRGNLLLGLEFYAAEGTPFFMPLYFGVQDLSEPACDFRTQSCSYLVAESHFDGQCLPVYGFDNAEMNGGVLTAGGPDTEFDVNASWGSTPADLTLFDVQLNGVVTGNFESFSGLVGFALTRDDLKVLLNSIDDDDIPAGYSKALVEGWIDALPAEYDVDGDGNGDAVSMGVHLDMNAATITGCGDNCSNDADCDDGNICTVDECSVEAGCTNFPVPDGIACDDGDILTEGDMCVDGICGGVIPDCDPATTLLSGVAITDGWLGSSGLTGEGLDVDGDPLTCSPDGNCEAGINNFLASLSAVFTPAFVEQYAWPAITDAGTVVADLENLRTDGVPFFLAMFYGTVDPAGGPCDFHTENCDFVIPRYNYDDTCQPIYGFDNAVVNGTDFNAGGVDTDWRIQTNVDGTYVDFVAHNVMVEGQLVDNGTAYVFEGIAGLAIEVDDLDAAISIFDVSSVLPYSESQLRSIVQALLDDPDVDTDGDGINDAVSIGVHIQGGEVSLLDSPIECSTNADCEDNNPCTNTWCGWQKNCNTSYNTDPCDDGDPSTVNDTCTNGICVGEYESCQPFVDFSDVQIVHEAEINPLDTGIDGFPRALNVDDDNATCSVNSVTSTVCNGSLNDGLDNAAAAVAAVVNPVLMDFIANGTIGFMMDFGEFETTGQAFPLYVYQGELSPNNPTCDVTTQQCQYVVSYYNFDDSCTPLYVLDNAVISGDHLTAGGPSYAVTIDSFYNGSPLSLTVYNLHVDADVVYGPLKVHSSAGVIGAALKKTEIQAIISVVPDSDLQGYTRPFIQNLIDSVLENDIDTDGDGTPDAVSLAITAHSKDVSASNASANCAVDADCDDGNACTADECADNIGCVYTDLSTGLCDDGLPQTVNDHCILGDCGGYVEDCDPYTAMTNVLRANTVELGQPDDVSISLNIDGLGDTCAPYDTTLSGNGDCSVSGGVENQVSQLTAVVGAMAQDFLDDAYYNFLLDFSNFETEGVPFDLGLLAARKDPANAGCDPTLQSCDFQVSPFVFDEDCEHLFNSEAVIVGNQFSAGGPGTNIMVRTSYGGTYFEIMVYNVTLDGTVVHGSPVTAFDVIGGAAFKLADIQMALGLIDDATLNDLGVTRSYLQQIIDAILIPDIDTDGDGVADAVSAAGRFVSGPVGDVSVGQYCIAATDCDDNNPCTHNQCKSDFGCWFPLKTDGVACNDGDPLTSNTFCHAGECIEEIADCDPVVVFGNILRADDLAVLDSQLGSTAGLNIDGVDTTCAPFATGECSQVDGNDNAADALEATINSFLVPEVAGNDLSLLMDFKDLVLGGERFDLRMYYAERDAAYLNCDPSSQTCYYDIPRVMFDDACNPLHYFDNAEAYDLGGGLVQLLAGGVGYELPIVFTLAGVETTLYLYNAQLDLVASYMAGSVMYAEGYVGGALRHADLQNVLDNLDTSELIDVTGDGQVTEADRTFIQGLLDAAALGMLDMDTDGDGTNDAFSIVFDVELDQAVAEDASACGDGTCGVDEDACTCPDDCANLTGWTCAASVWADGVCDCGCGLDDVCDCAGGACGSPSGCGNGTCDAGENCTNCVADCACGGSDTCFTDACCTPSCAGVECGHDGCGGWCGACTGEYEACQDGACVMALGDCAEMLRCIEDCGGGATCQETCLNAAPAQAQQLYLSMMLCVIGECGLSPTTECTIWALDSSCKSAYDACVDYGY